MSRSIFLFVSFILLLSNCGGGVNTPPSQPASSGNNGSGGNQPTQPVSSFAEMCNQPGVLFCDDFENGIDSSWIRDGGDVAVVPGTAVSGEGSHVVELRTYENIQSSKIMQTFPIQDDVFVRFDVQYDVDYDNSGGSHGPVLGGSMNPPWGMYGKAGIKPQGNDYFTANFEPFGIVGVDGQYSFYSYFVNMQPDGLGNYWGNYAISSLSPPPYVLPGQWQCVEFEVKMNTPGTANTDGAEKFWIDGVESGSFSGIQWRTVQSLGINTFSLDSYNHFRNGALPASNPNRVRYDNIVISTSRVGCL